MVSPNLYFVPIMAYIEIGQMETFVSAMPVQTYQGEPAKQFLATGLLVNNF